MKKLIVMLLSCIVAVGLCSCSNASGTTGGSIVDYANAALNQDDISLFTYNNSAELDSLLTAMSNDKSLYDNDTIHRVYLRTNGCGSVETSALKQAMMEQIPESDYDFLHSDDNGLIRVLSVYSASGKWSEKKAVERIVSLHNGQICEANYPSRYTYSGEISAIKVENTENSDESAWVVAILITATENL